MNEINYTAHNDNINVLRIRVREGIDSFIESLKRPYRVLRVKRWKAGGENYAHVTDVRERIVYLVEERR